LFKVASGVAEPVFNQNSTVTPLSKLDFKLDSLDPEPYVAGKPAVV